MWSIGVITYILLCGKPPFFGTTDDEIKKAVCEDELVFRQDCWKQISPIAKTFITKLIERDPEKRYTAN
jgi:serine/threonine protein kinase